MKLIIHTIYLIQRFLTEAQFSGGQKVALCATRITYWPKMDTWHQYFFINFVNFKNDRQCKSTTCHVNKTGISYEIQMKLRFFKTAYHCYCSHFFPEREPDELWRDTTGREELEPWRDTWGREEFELWRDRWGNEELELWRDTIGRDELELWRDTDGGS